MASRKETWLVVVPKYDVAVEGHYSTAVRYPLIVCMRGFVPTFTLKWTVDGGEKKHTFPSWGDVVRWAQFEHGMQSVVYTV